MSDYQEITEKQLQPLLGSKIVCPKCFRPTLEVVSVNGSPFHCKRPNGCGKSMTIKDYGELALKNVTFSFFQEIFSSLFKRVQNWS